MEETQEKPLEEKTLEEILEGDGVKWENKGEPKCYYACVKDGKVVNRIVCANDDVAEVQRKANGWDSISCYDKIEKHLQPQIGWTYSNGEYSAPVPPAGN